MLYEIRGTKQREGEDYRKWFTDEYFDLFVWFDEAGAISGFQLSYDKSADERAITWQRKGGFMHTKVDDGEKRPTSSMTPILVSDGIFDYRSIAGRFKREAKELDPELVRFIIKKVLEFPAENK